MLQFNLALSFDDMSLHTFDDVISILQENSRTLSSSSEPLAAGEEATVFDHNDSAIGRWKVVSAPDPLPTRSQLLALVSRREAQQSVNVAHHEEYVVNGVTYSVGWKSAPPASGQSGHWVTYKCERPLTA